VKKDKMMEAAEVAEVDSVVVIEEVEVDMEEIEVDMVEVIEEDMVEVEVALVEVIEEDMVEVEVAEVDSHRSTNLLVEETLMASRVARKCCEHYINYIKIPFLYTIFLFLFI
jgi:hypothetical protein